MRGWRESAILPCTVTGVDALLATAFDPLAAARDLKAAGFESEQAEALAAQLRVAAGADHADLATKADVAALHTAMKADVAALRTETKTAIASLRAELGSIRWAVGLMAAFTFAIGLRVFGLI